MHDLTYPAELPITPLTTTPGATVTVPGSKSITNRALVLAAMGGIHSCELRGALQSEDTEVMIRALQRLGCHVEADQDERTTLFVSHPEQLEQAPDTADLFVGNSGTTVRFLTAMLGTLTGRFRLDGVPRMRERPIEELLDGMRQLGVDARSEGGNGCPPVAVNAKGRMGGTARIRGDRSSQFLSGLLMVGPFTRTETVIEIDGPLVSEPYVAMTLAMIDQFGYQVDVGPGHRYRFPPNQGRHFCGGYDIEPDASAASYFWAAAAVTGGRVTVTGLTRKSLQGDVRFVDVLAQMGCRVEECESGITVHGGRLRGVDADMNDISDTVMTLGAVALFADGPTTIRNVAHIRHKETDRIAALANELRKFGAGVEEREDGLTITPRPLRGAAVDTYNDHRMAMSLALVGLKVPGVVIRNPGCVAKTYPGFWQDWEKLR
ncbi:MAG TPA: 3-phosphoshikimate 1-carboxyvinyltransferase [Urbifossiella sp.]|jgi:3-phosphoshikimate 1-carboxyvinyltransferase|nr:3-phosphoshikimate 1-carboxyvinyltransferase [Urbifossiella sp.]